MSIVSIGVLVSTIILFQNCGNSMSFKSLSETETHLSSNSTVDPLPAMSFSDDTTVSMKVSLNASQAAQTDCSLDAASLSLEVLDASEDIRVCLQYEIDQPVGSPRHNDKYFCDNESKFEKPPKNWTYDPVQKRWSTSTAKLKNNAQFIPGSYALFVKDDMGRTSNSATRVIKKAGAVSCDVTGQNANKCFWRGPVFGPSLSSEPTKACTLENANTTALDGNGATKTCYCDAVPAPQAPMITYGRLGPLQTSPIRIVPSQAGNSTTPPVTDECFLGGTWAGYYQCSGVWEGEGASRSMACTGWTRVCQ